MSDGNRLVALYGVGLINKASILQGSCKWPWVRCNIRTKQMELPLVRRTYRLARQTCQLLILQGIYRYRFVQCSVVSPKVRI